ncbi:MAG: hypothetical protein N3E51_03620 [Candidatus Micrarchaeota archaeon]|nr:hypothetical protein [Candidatus Micrarchaeota archaeon]
MVAPAKKNGQSGIEFLVMSGIVLLAFSAALSAYFLLSSEAEAKQDALEANAVCLDVSASINSLASLRGNASHSFALPRQINGKNYTIYVSSASRLVKVDYGYGGVGCRLATSAISNSTGAGLFVLRRNATIAASNGLVRAVP